MCTAGFLHDGGDVGKVQIDDDILGEAHQLGDGGNGLLQHIVGNAECIGEGDLLIGDVLQPVIGDDNQGIHLGAQLGNALLCLTHTVGALEAEGLGDNTHGEDAGLVGQISHDGSCAGAGAAAHTGGDEHHIGAFQDLGDGRAALLGGLLADLRLGACAHAAGQLLADLHLILADRLIQVLLIGVHGHKLHAVHTGTDHTVNNIIACTANTNDLDLDDTLQRTIGHIYFLLCIVSQKCSRYRRLFSLMLFYSTVKMGFGQ